MSNLRFSLLLKAVMNEYGVTGKKLEEILKERGVEDITHKRISEYVRAISTPSLEKAKNIMCALDFPIEEDSLKESLKINRELVKLEKSERVLMNDNGWGKCLTVNIKLKNVSDGDSIIDNERKILERVNDLYGTHNINRYVENLIFLDLKKSILKKVGDHDEN